MNHDERPKALEPETFEHQRHKAHSELKRPRELIVACVPMRSNVNLSTIARTASACAAQKLILCGNANVIAKIARDGTSELEISTHRTLGPPLRKLAKTGYRLVGLEQTTRSTSMHSFRFERKTVLVVGNERLGISQEILDFLDDVIEIPVYGLPHSYNVGTAAGMALYEYCKQFPRG